MSNLSQVYEQLSGRKPTDKQIMRIHRICSAIGVPDNDTFMALVVALDFYWGIYSSIPKRIDEATEKAAQNAVTTAKAEIERLTAEQQEKLADAVYRSSTKVAKAASTKTMISWIASAFVICTLALCSLSYFMYLQGMKIGTEKGYISARNEELILMERDQFQKSSIYPLVVAYDQAGLLEDILTCHRRGWYIENGKCIPSTFTDKDGKKYTAPWNIPNVDTN